MYLNPDILVVDIADELVFGTTIYEDVMDPASKGSHSLIGSNGFLV